MQDVAVGRAGEVGLQVDVHVLVDVPVEDDAGPPDEERAPGADRAVGEIVLELVARGVEAVHANCEYPRTERRSYQWVVCGVVSACAGAASATDASRVDEATR
jgi:hypothetical protein